MGIPHGSHRALEHERTREVGASERSCHSKRSTSDRAFGRRPGVNCGRSPPSRGGLMPR